MNWPEVPSEDTLATKAARRARALRRSRSRRAVSDVVATILLLALTVVLFSSIFAFVTSFPAPPAQNSNQFQAEIVSASNGTGTMASAISILHLAGPTVPSTAQIYLKSSVYPRGPEFQSPYTLAAGGITGNVWNLGQTWYLTNFTAVCGGGHASICNPILPDNITVYIVSSSTLLFSVVLPGTIITYPPTFLSLYTVPTVPAVGEQFTIYSSIGGVTSTNTVKLNLSGVPGLTTTPVSMTYSASTGLWSYTVTAGQTTTSGTYYGLLSASNTNGLTGRTAVPISLASYSTQISTAITVGSVSTPAKCTGTPVAGCYAPTTSYYFTVSLTTSLVTFGSVLFQVVNTTPLHNTYYAKQCAAFALALTSTPKVSVANWTSSGSASSMQQMLMPGSGFSYYAAGYSSNSALVASSSTGGITISVDLGITSPATTLMFVILGTGAYSGSISVSIP